MFRRILKWVFRKELKELETTISSSKYFIEENKIKGKRLDNLLGSIDVSVDVHQYSRSWAVISIQGQRSDYIKFVDLGQSQIRDIQRFLHHFDRSKIDASPHASKFLRIN